MASETLNIIVKLRDLASGQIRTLTAGVGTLRTGVQGLGGALFSLRGIIATVGLGALSRSFIRAADTAESYRIRLNVLLGSQREGNRLFEEMSKFASGVAFEYEEIMGGATALAGVMRGGVDEIKEWMPMIADLAAVSGLGIRETTDQIIRMYSTGAASARLFRERGILAMLGFQQGVTYSAEITKKKLIEAFEDPQSKFRGASESLSKTWSGMMSMMADRWFQFRNLVMEEGGVFDYIKFFMDRLLKYFKQLETEGNLAEWARRIGDTVIKVLEYIAIGVGWVGDSFRGWKMIWAFLEIGVAQLYRAIGKALQAIISSAKFVLDSLAKIGDSIEWLIRKLADFWKFLADMASKIPGIGGAFAAMYDALGDAADKVADSIGSGIDKLRGWGNEIEKNKEILKEVDDEIQKTIDSAMDKLYVIAAEVPYHEKVKKLLQEAREELEKIRNLEKTEEPDLGVKRPDPVDTRRLRAQYTAEIEKVKELSNTALTELNALYQNHMLGMVEYFMERKTLLDRQYESEKAHLEKMLDLSEDPSDKIKIETQIFKLQENYKRQLIAYEQEFRKATEDRVKGQIEAVKLLEDAEKRASLAGIFDLGAIFASEVSDLERTQREEMDRYLDLVKEGHASELELIDLQNAHKLEKERLFADQERRLNEDRLQMFSRIAGGIAETFDNLYKASGENVKEFFYISKAAAVAQAMINANLAATEALAKAGNPYLGMALAAVIYASALANVAAIAAQSYAEGGKVKGYSPTKKSDNIPAWVTAGEFVQPVDSVKKYGLYVMEKLRRGEISAQLLNIVARYPELFGNRLRAATGGLATQATFVRGMSIPTGNVLASGGLTSHAFGKPQTGFIDPSSIKVEINNKSPDVVVEEGDVRYDPALRRYILSVTVDARQRNVQGYRHQMGVR